MIQISVESNLEATVSQWAWTMGDQMPYATALALTRTAPVYRRKPYGPSGASEWHSFAVWHAQRKTG